MVRFREGSRISFNVEQDMAKGDKLWKVGRRILNPDSITSAWYKPSVMETLASGDKKEESSELTINVHGERMSFVGAKADALYALLCERSIEVAAIKGAANEDSA